MGVPGKKDAKSSANDKKLQNPASEPVPAKTPQKEAPSSAIPEAEKNSLTLDKQKGVGSGAIENVPTDDKKERPSPSTKAPKNLVPMGSPVLERKKKSPSPVKNAKPVDTGDVDVDVKKNPLKSIGNVTGSPPVLDTVKKDSTKPPCQARPPVGAPFDKRK